MSFQSGREIYELEEAPEEIKQVIRIAQTAEPLEADENRLYALYSESDGRERRHTAIAEYKAEYNVFKMEGMLAYNPDKKEIRIREMDGRSSNPLMTPKKVPEYNLESAKSLLESD